MVEIRVEVGIGVRVVIWVRIRVGGRFRDRFGLGFSFTVRFRVRFAIRFRLVQKIKGVLNYPPPAWYGVMFSAVTTVRPSVCPSHYLPHSLYGHYIYPSG